MEKSNDKEYNPAEAPRLLVLCSRMLFFLLLSEQKYHRNYMKETHPLYSKRCCFKKGRKRPLESSAPLKFCKTRKGEQENPSFFSTGFTEKPSAVPKQVLTYMLLFSGPSKACRDVLQVENFLSVGKSRLLEANRQTKIRIH